MKPTFENTVSILVKAYLSDELAHSLCSACAVGNIVAASIGTRPMRCKTGPTEFENGEFENGEDATLWLDALHNLNCNAGEMQIRATGYTHRELLRIEAAFEAAPGRPEKPGIWRGKQVDPEWMFNGLMAVVDVLAEIHGVDLSVKESAKLQFVKP